MKSWMKALVIGTGWYGCEIASRLESLCVDFDMLDRKDDFFSESSSKNQNRLHFGGFHYCRSHVTRVECRRGYDVFIEKYPEFSRQVDSYYLVSQKSVLDFETYVSIFLYEKSPFLVESIDDLYNKDICLEKTNFHGNRVVLVKERWIDFKQIREHFKKRFGNKLLKFDETKLKVSDDKKNITFDGQKYDTLFDATYGKLFPLNNSFFELCITLIYKRNQIDTSFRKTAITVVDGDFFSLYPYDVENDLYTLTHVKQTPMISSKIVSEVEDFQKSITQTQVLQKKVSIEKDVSSYWTNFLDTFTYTDYFLSTKTKFNDVLTADRSIREQTRGNVVSVCGGKITGSFDVKEVVDRTFRNYEKI